MVTAVCLSVCLYLAVFPHYCTDRDVTLGMVGAPSSCALLGRFAISARVLLLRQHSAEREMSPSACSRSMPGSLSFGCQGAEHCRSCRRFQDGPYCVSVCPDLKYPDADGACRPCHRDCRGCTGPGDRLGPGGCVACSSLLLDDRTTTSRRCLNESVAECPLEFYFFRAKVRVTASEHVASVN